MLHLQKNLNTSESSIDPERSDTMKKTTKWQIYNLIWNVHLCVPL